MSQRVHVPSSAPPDRSRRGAQAGISGHGSVARPLHIAYVTVAGGGGETYVREQARALASIGHRVSILYLHHSPPSGGDATWHIVQSTSFFRHDPLPGIADAHSEAFVPHLEYVAPSNLHYLYGRCVDLLPASIRKYAPSQRSAKEAETALALRVALWRISRAVERIDVVEFPDHVEIPAVLLVGLPPYAVKLHSSTPDWHHFCGLGITEHDRHTIGVESALLRGARLIHAPSVHMADHAARFYGIPRSRICVLPCPVDVTSFTPKCPHAKAGCITGAGNGGWEAPHSVLYVGRLDSFKGVQALARAAEPILNACPATVIEIVGGETDEVNAESLRALIPESFHHRFVFHGRIPRDDLPGYYRRASVCVVPSQWESFCYTAAESLACGTPVVASDTGALPELVVPGRTGLLVPRDDPQALAGSVVRLLCDPERRSRLAQAGREHILSKCESGHIASQIASMYYVMLGIDVND